MSNKQWSPPWLRGYASDLYDWHRVQDGGRTHYWRRQGLVEGLFDHDGTGFEGRADLNMAIQVEVRTSLDLAAFRTRIAQVWSVMRQRHVLMSARAINVRDISPSLERGDDRIFVSTPCQSVEELFNEGNRFLDFVEDTYPKANPDDFYSHLMNTGRAIDPTQALSRLIVLPFQHTSASMFKLHLVIVAGHQVADGLTTFRWMNTPIAHLNLSSSELNTVAKSLVSTSPNTRLPPSQESLYPPITGSRARQRWFWLITRILRHTARPNPASFQNPLRRSTPLSSAQAFPRKYSLLLDYTNPPLNNSHTVSATLSPSSTTRLLSLCHTASISIGSGLFTLVALSMMTLHEQAHPSIPSSQRLPFVGSFPLNPRPFLSGPSTTGSEDSLMLAFSDGITLPFLSCDLPLKGRFRLLGKQTHRQLKSYQKRKRSIHEDLALGTKSSKFLLPTFYLSSQDRLAARLASVSLSGSLGPSRSSMDDIQGVYTPSAPLTLATCGVSSVGDRTSLISSGKYDLNLSFDSKSTKDVAADFRDGWTFVRPRDGEFLVGAAGSRDQQDGSICLTFGVSYDGNVIDPEKAREWKILIEGLLEGEAGDGERKGEARL